MEQTLVEIVGLSTEDPAFFSTARRAIQLYVEGRPILLVETTEERRYASILEKFLNDRGLEYKRVNAPNEYASQKVPSTLGDNYEVVGMGILKIDPASKRYAALGGNSETYQMKIDPEHEKLVLETFKSLGYSV